MKFTAWILSLLFSAQGFATSIDDIRKHAVPLAPHSIPKELLREVDGKQLLLIGESHGIKEMPEFTLDLVKALSSKQKVLLGFEFPIELEKQIQNFVETGDESILKNIPFFQNGKIHSGRGSQAMVALLKNLKGLKNVEVFCFDGPVTKEIPERDTVMAKNIIAKLNLAKDALVITYSGNIHSRITPGYPGNPSHTNMGSEVLRLSGGILSSSNVTNILFRYDEGSAWQCWSTASGDSDCSLHTLKSSHTDYAKAVNDPEYFLKESELTDSHQMTVFIRHVTASLPLM